MITQTIPSELTRRPHNKNGQSRRFGKASWNNKSVCRRPGIRSNCKGGECAVNVQLIQHAQCDFSFRILLNPSQLISIHTLFNYFFLFLFYFTYLLTYIHIMCLFTFEWLQKYFLSISFKHLFQWWWWWSSLGNIKFWFTNSASAQNLQHTCIILSQLRNLTLTRYYIRHSLCMLDSSTYCCCSMTI